MKLIRVLITDEAVKRLFLSIFTEQSEKKKCDLFLATHEMKWLEVETLQSDRAEPPPQVCSPPEPGSPALLRRRLRMTSSSLSFFPGGDGPDSWDPRLGLRFTVSWRQEQLSLLGVYYSPLKWLNPELLYSQGHTDINDQINKYSVGLIKTLYS